jgi:hypothetical protein
MRSGLPARARAAQRLLEVDEQPREHARQARRPGVEPDRQLGQLARQAPTEVSKPRSLAGGARPERPASSAARIQRVSRERVQVSSIP